MKKALLILGTILFINLLTFASGTVFSNLMSVNREWIRQKDALPFLSNAAMEGNQSYTKWIATHLMLVEQTLRSRSVSQLTASQALNRQNLLDELHRYR